MKQYFVYILTNFNRTVLYTGVTNDLHRRLQEHAADARTGKKSFAGRYNCVYLIYYETYHSIKMAIAREKEIKDLARNKKDALINAFNPNWTFLNL